MSMRLPAVVALALLAVPATASAQAPRPCEPGELGDARTPVTVNAGRVGSVEKALVAGRRYRAERVIELANGAYPDSSPYRRSSARPGSITVAGPLGMDLEPIPASGNFRGGFEFTAPREKSLTLSISWNRSSDASRPANASSITTRCAAFFPAE